MLVLSVVLNMFRNPDTQEVCSPAAPAWFGLLGATRSWLSCAYMYHPKPSCLRLFRQAMPVALVFARFNAGRSIAARMAMMAMTTSSSIRV